VITPEDLAATQSIAAERWRTHGPYVEHHIGDIAWGAGTQTALLHGGGYAVRDGDEWHLGGDDGAMPALVAAARDAGADVWALDAETAKLEALRANGFVPRERGFWHLVHDLRDLAPVTVPVVSGGTDPDRRVALHRAAWEPSRFTRETYDAVRATPPYRDDLDLVADWKAYALAWYDAHSASGELEPVGTAPPYRRRGYGAAACLAALHRLRDLGARHAVVYAVDDPANPGPKALYESIGFAVADRHVRYSPPTRHNAAKPGER
jgi:GNAT superfamily N-acetyltransferase